MPMSTDMLYETQEMVMGLMIFFLTGRLILKQIFKSRATTYKIEIVCRCVIAT